MLHSLRDEFLDPLNETCYAIYIVKMQKRPTMGYPAVEALIESEDFDDVNEAFAKAYDELAEAYRKKRGLRRSRDAKKAMTSLELTMELFRELLALKYELKEQLARRKGAKSLA